MPPPRSFCSRAPEQPSLSALSPPPLHLSGLACLLGHGGLCGAKTCVLYAHIQMSFEWNPEIAVVPALSARRVPWGQDHNGMTGLCHLGAPHRPLDILHFPSRVPPPSWKSVVRRISHPATSFLSSGRSTPAFALCPWGQSQCQAPEASAELDSVGKGPTQGC